ncbi:MAG: hypothetical protein M5U12_07180 [Verrucomicrobia bacterium]|nr:hypothetical protein [Verrucomicrobiota bacterium]
MADFLPIRCLRSCCRRGWLTAALKVALRLLIVGLLLGWLYGWAGPRLYPPDRVPGFGWGVAHGACMPMALPALLMGQDVSIFAPCNTGRGYKLGYIAGINLCGLVFFGGAFWKPRPATSPAPQNHHER